MKKIFFGLILLLGTVSCNARGYSISTSGKEITVKMHQPSVGFIGTNAVHWPDDPDEIGKDIYEMFVGFFDSRKSGTYIVSVYWMVKNSYGKDELQYAGSYSFDAAELRKYDSYYYSKGYRDVPDLIYKMAFGNRLF